METHYTWYSTSLETSFAKLVLMMLNSEDFMGKSNFLFLFRQSKKMLTKTEVSKLYRSMEIFRVFRLWSSDLFSIKTVKKMFSEILLYSDQRTLNKSDNSRQLPNGVPFCMNCFLQSSITQGWAALVLHPKASL